MYYEVRGEGKPIVFLHGWGCDHSIFLPIVSRLPNYYSNYLIDLNGFGKSEAPNPNGWTVVDYAERLKGFFDEHDLQSVSIVAHSFGCRVAMVLASTYPQLVDRMLFVAPAGLRKFSLKRWFSVTRYRATKFFVKHSQFDTGKFGSQDYRSCNSDLKNTLVKVVNQDLSSYAKRVSCPVLIVNGRNDTATPLSHAKRLNKLIKGSQLVAIDGDHFAFFCVPTAFANTVKTFVE